MIDSDKYPTYYATSKYCDFDIGENHRFIDFHMNIIRKHPVNLIRLSVTIEGKYSSSKRYRTHILCDIGDTKKWNPLDYSICFYPSFRSSRKLRLDYIHLTRAIQDLKTEFALKTNGIPILIDLPIAFYCQWCEREVHSLFETDRNMRNRFLLCDECENSERLPILACALKIQNNIKK